MKVAAIVLAGGRSSRFGRDKLAVDVDGRPLLWRAIEAARASAADVIVTVGPGAAADLPEDLPPGVRVAHDARAHEGPLAGVATGLAATDADVAIVVAGDMPSIVPAVLTRLVAGLDDPGVDAVLLGTPPGSTDPGRPLPMALRCDPARRTAAELLASGERRLRALPARLGAVRIPDAEWRLDDPEGSTLRDIDIPADLER